MNPARAGALALLCIGAAIAPFVFPESAAADEAASRAILVMLRSAPPHFRPDSSYSGSYDARAGRDARRRAAEAVAAQYDLRIVENWPMPALGVDCFVMATAADDAAIVRIVADVVQDPRVESVQAMNVFHLLAHNDPLYALQPSAAAWHLDAVHKVATGKGVSVAEIDTGVERRHPDLDGRVAVWRNFVDARDDVAELHGTAVAGIVAARADDGLGVAGVAPESRLLALRACWETARRATCNSFTIAKALQFALEQNVQVINLSLGGPRDRLLERLLDVAQSRGVTIVAAIDPTSSDGGFPASHRGALAVAADDVHDMPANALLAPGRDIPTTVTDGRWGFVTGSSFAAAHVAGLVALLRELSPKLNAGEIRDALEGPSPTSSGRGRRGTVDACAAIAKVGGICACVCAVAAQAPPSLR